MIIHEAMSKLNAIIPAAGNSRRYGRCKQLEKLNGSTLIKTAISKLLSIFENDKINVVVGADSGDIVDNIQTLQVNIIYNHDWETGIASSLKAALREVETDSEAVMMTLCDQVLITENHLNQLTERWLQNRLKIIASSYADTIGTPAIIPARFFPEIFRLTGDTGAKSILMNNPEHTVELPVPEAEFDVDTPAELEKLKEFLK